MVVWPRLRVTAREDQVMLYAIWIAPDPLDGGWAAGCPDLPGCFGQGETREEALADLADAVRAVAELREDLAGHAGCPAVSLYPRQV